MRIVPRFSYCPAPTLPSKVDLASGVCTPQTSRLTQHGALLGCTAARLADGRIVCVGMNYEDSLQGTAQVLEPPPPEQGSPSEANWQWRYLPDMSALSREFRLARSKHVRVKHVPLG
jgi:hypothetical protein